MNKAHSSRRPASSVPPFLCPSSLPPVLFPLPVSCSSSFKEEVRVVSPHQPCDPCWSLLLKLLAPNRAWRLVFISAMSPEFTPKEKALVCSSQGRAQWPSSEIGPSPAWPRVPPLSSQTSRGCALALQAAFVYPGMLCYSAPRASLSWKAGPCSQERTSSFPRKSMGSV